MGKDAPAKKGSEVLVNAEQIKKITRSRAFSQPQPVDRSFQNRFFIFRWPGDQIEGTLGPPITNYRRNTSYPVELPDADGGGIKEIFGNKPLHETIRKNELIGSYVRIVYIGLQKVPTLARSRKIYEVWKISGTDETKM